MSNAKELSEAIGLGESQDRGVRDMQGFIAGAMKRGEEAVWKVWGLTTHRPPEEYEFMVTVDPAFGVAIEDTEVGYNPMRLVATKDMGKVKSFFKRWVKTLSWDRQT